jgi:hypothetical protein
MAAADVRPSWGWLGLAGLVGGGPTFLGMVVGTRFESAFRTAPSLPREADTRLSAGEWPVRK